MAGKLAFLQAITSLHCGTGQGVGSIDVPIARERATALPIVPGSTIKGCLRDALAPEGGIAGQRLTKEKWRQVFGPERGAESADFSGALRVSDGHLLLLPVRCLAATYVWATSPFILRRLQRDAAAAGLSDVPKLIPELKDSDARVASADPLVTIGGKKKLVLEELDFTVEEKAAIDWAEWIAKRLYGNLAVGWQDEMKKRFAIIDDKSFTYLSEFSTEITAHIAMDKDKGTVAAGALWYQESLPAETVCYLLLQAERSQDRTMSSEQVLAAIPETNAVQFGGKATTGLGVARLVPVGGKP